VSASAGGPSHASGRSDAEFLAFQGRIQPAIERTIKRQIRNEDDRKDLLSRVLEEIWLKWDSVRVARTKDAYVIGITSNTVIDFITRDKKKLRNQIRLTDWNQDLHQVASNPAPYLDVELRDFGERLKERMLEACTPDERHVMTLVLKGNEIREVAGVLKMNERTVRSHFLRGRANLLAHLRIHAPDLLGGEDHLIGITERYANDLDVRLTHAEIDEIRSPSGRLTILKQAMLKIAPKLGPHCLLILLARGIR